MSTGSLSCSRRDCRSPKQDLRPDDTSAAISSAGNVAPWRQGRSSFRCGRVANTGTTPVRDVVPLAAHKPGTDACEDWPRERTIVRPTSNRFRPLVSVMQTAHSGNPHDLRMRRGTLDDGPTQRRFLRQGIVGTIFMIVPEVTGPPTGVSGSDPSLSASRGRSRRATKSTCLPTRSRIKHGDEESSLHPRRRPSGASGRTASTRQRGARR